jgi:hypothetical protein
MCTAGVAGGAGNDPAGVITKAIAGQLSWVQAAEILLLADEKLAGGQVFERESEAWVIEQTRPRRWYLSSLFSPQFVRVRGSFAPDRKAQHQLPAQPSLIAIPFLESSSIAAGDL